MRNNFLVFDIETIPDVELGRKMIDVDIIGESDDWLASATDAEIGDAMFKEQLLKTDGKTEFLPLPFHQIGCISVVSCVDSKDGPNAPPVIWVGTLNRKEGKPAEPDQVAAFFKLIDNNLPRIVSWNGGTFDLPVLQLRALKHGIRSSKYWDNGDRDRDFRFNNYRSRYHMRHTDVMDVIANYGMGRSSLDRVAVLCGLPGKIGVGGGAVWDAYKADNLAGVMDYCEIDVINTWLVFCRYMLICGDLVPERYETMIAETQRYLADQDKAERPHMLHYLDAWVAGVAGAEVVL